MPGPRALVVVIAVLAAGPARAQDALRGKRLYLDAARIVGSGVSCVDCHGGLPRGLYGIDRAADDPELVRNAVESIPQMTPFRGRLAGSDFADLAAYIGNPAVPSPQLQLTTRRPGGDAGPQDRIEFGEIEADAASAAATLQITNTGQLAFGISGAPGIDGTNGDEFSLEAADCGTGAIVEPGGSCRFTLVFRPAGAAGARVARFTVSHDWVFGIAAVALLGTAAPPAASQPPSPGCSSGNGHTAAPLLAWLLLPCGRRRARRSPHDHRHAVTLTRHGERAIG